MGRPPLKEARPQPSLVIDDVWDFNLPLEWPISVLPRLGDEYFDTLSRLNVDIHKGWELVSRVGSQTSFAEFICKNDTLGSGYENLQNLMSLAQEFLVVIKALHRQLGTRPVTRQQSPTMTPSFDALFALPSEPSFEEASLDAPTMFLIISCYTLLVKHIEIIFKSIYDSVSDTSREPIGPAPMAFAHVPILEASGQFILFSELVRHILGQISLVLGLPSSWSGRSAWTGLLKGQRYRDMVNAELGAVDGLWTTRPAKLMDTIQTTKDIFVELSMMGLDSPITQQRHIIDAAR